MNCFTSILQKDTEYQKLNKAISTHCGPVGAIGLPQINKMHILSAICDEQGKKAFVITPDEASAIKAYEDLCQFTDGVLLYPQREFTFLEVEGISREFEHIRLGVLSKILKNEYSIIVASVGAACQLTMPPKELDNRIFTLKEGEEINIDDTINKLVLAGYSRFDQVDGTSQFSVRGGLIDIFPPGADEPVRIELWGDEIDSITKFDIATQRRSTMVKSIDIIPATEVLFDSKEKQAKKIEELASTLKGKAIKAREKLLDDSNRLKQGLNLRCNDKYLPLAYKSNGLFDYINDSLLFVCESQKVKERCENQNKLMLEDLKWLVNDSIICKGLDKYLLTFDELCEVYNSSFAIYLDSFPRGSFDTPVKSLSSFICQSFNAWSGTLTQLKDELIPLVKTNYAVCIMAGTSRSAKALAYDLEEIGYNAHYYEKMPTEFQHGAIAVVGGTMSSGFQLSSCKFALITYSKMSQTKKKHKRFNSKDAIHSLDELVVGDYIVHNIHGVGVFQGIHALDLGNVSKDYIKISYAKGDTLYVPVTQLDLVSKYIGPKEDSKVKINRLGSGDWTKAKAKVRAAVQDMAKELIALYSKRHSTQGYAFGADTDMQRDFELRFEYEETDDQLRCTDEIKADMESQHPMDRLLCGDVGFGKTEVALRACFKCIEGGKQCAILVPTTVLAMQHFQTALKRLEPFPVKIEMLSRFVSPTKQKEVLKNLKEGSVDLVIGTHRIFSKDIEFKDLGLLIIDEEQRFGVAQKEKIKQRYPKVDVLTLSATPIPRTLNMALGGIRDMSMLEEAPGDRKPIQSYVLEYDFGVLVEAMSKELSRGGQCYFLHNDIASLNHVALQIKKALPDANVGIAHGKMTEEELSDVWEKLINNEIDVLVCTTIIETGVDVPNVNTLIIDNADRMGLAQLHQIRGRVGRSSRRGYAYFTFKNGAELTEIAQRRLEAIREYTEFGAGFKIAMRDLEIRGAGSLLGDKQHGHIESVGYDMYIKLLEEAVSIEKGENVRDEKEQECLIDLPVDASIPTSYIASTPQRLDMYKTIANVRSQADADEVYDEMTDRFGVPPMSVYGLVDIALLRNIAQKLGIYEIKQIGVNVRFYINDIKPEYLIALNEKMRNRAKLNSGAKTFISVETIGGNTIDTVKEVLNLLEQSTKNE